MADNYFVGRGVYTFEGEDYGTGDKLPASVPKETIESMRAKGKVSDSPARVITVANDDSLKAELAKIKESAARWEATMDDLRGELANATKTAEELKTALDQAQNTVAERDKELEQAQRVVAERDKELEQAQATIAELTAQLTSPAPAVPAGPKAKG